MQNFGVIVTATTIGDWLVNTDLWRPKTTLWRSARLTHPKTIQDFFKMSRPF